MAPTSPALDLLVDSRLDLETEIRRLKRERNAVILAHYYQDSEIQDLADHVGDSLQLSQAAAETEADVIAFCGVHFMAETAKILNPSKIVVVPDLDAGCSLADRCPADAFEAWLRNYPGHVVVSYINCSAAVKALSDVICTSSNAVRVVNSIPKDLPIVFAPDRHLGVWVEKQTGRKMVLWPGFCVVHEQFTSRRLIEMQRLHPGAEIIAPRVRGIRVGDGRLHRQHDGAPQSRQDESQEVVHRRDGDGHPPRDVEGAPRRRVDRRPARFRLLVCDVPLHAPQHDGEALPRPPRPRARDRD